MHNIPAKNIYTIIKSPVKTAGLALLTLLIGVFSFAGCGSNGGGVEDWQTPSASTALVDVTGTVLAPVAANIYKNTQTNTSVSATAQAGVTVFMEERPDLSAVTDSAGKFLIHNVPVGKWHIIAETADGGTTYRRRSDLLSLTSEHSVWELSSPIQLHYAPYKIHVNVFDRDKETGIASAKLTLWGRSVSTDVNGNASLGPVPEGAWQISMAVSGYNSRVVPINFGDNQQTDLYVALTPATAINRNTAPIVGLTKTFTSLRQGESGGLSAMGMDMDGDVIEFNWSASAGTFSNPKSQSTLFTAPNAPGWFVVTVSGSDGKGGIGKAGIEVYVGDDAIIPTNPTNRIPNNPTAPIPQDGAQNVSTSPTLAWKASDPDGDSLTYDLFLSKLGSPLVQVATNLATASYQLQNLDVFQNYIWKVICRDRYGAINIDSPIWQFKTGDGNNQPPYTPENPSPPNGAEDQPPSLVLTWIGGDPDPNDQVTYEIWLATGSSASLGFISQTTFPNAPIEGLSLGTVYRWQVVATDQRAGRSVGPIWTFKTRAPDNNPPFDPIVRNPASGATNVALKPQLRWEASDPDGDNLTYNVYLGMSNPLACIASGIQYNYFDVPQTLAPKTTYLWQVTVRDSGGLLNPNPVIWTFTTAEKANQPPLTPTLTAPVNGAVQVATQPTLAWSASDPDGDILTYDVFMGASADSLAKVCFGITDSFWSVSPPLSHGQKYFWCVRASDGVSSVTSSVFSFTTIEEIGADTVPPHLLSIIPADGASGVSSDTSVVLTFSEPMYKQSVIDAVSFSPPIAVDTSWDSPSIVRFTPKKALYPGSYNKVSLAANVAKDLSNNALVESAKSAFTVVSDLPLPSNYHSAAFPATLYTGGSADFTVPDLGIGRPILAAVVGLTSNAKIDIKPSEVANLDSQPLNEAFLQTPEAAVRELERRLGTKRVHQAPYGALRPSVRAASVGTQRNFYITAYEGAATSTVFPNNKITARCVAATSQLYIYVDNAITSPDYNFISQVTQRFENGIGPAIRDAFGDEPTSGPDGDSHLTILLTDAMRSSIIGLFYGVDLYHRDATDIQLRESNECKMLYLRYSANGINDATRYGTVAHEFQHMVNFHEKQSAGGTSTYEETWLAEGEAKYAEDVAGYGVPAGDANTVQIIKLMQASFSNMSLTKWFGIESYGLSYLFVRFLAESGRYKATSREMTRQLTLSAATGIDNIENATGETFAQTLGRFYVSLLLNRYNSAVSGDYGIKGLNLAGTYAGITLSGMPVTSLSTQLSGISVPLHGCRYFNRPGSTQPTTLSIQNVQNSVQVWLLDQRQ